MSLWFAATGVVTSGNVEINAIAAVLTGACCVTQIGVPLWPCASFFQFTVPFLYLLLLQWIELLYSTMS